MLWDVGSAAIISRLSDAFGIKDHLGSSRKGDTAGTGCIQVTSKGVGVWLDNKVCVVLWGRWLSHISRIWEAAGTGCIQVGCKSAGMGSSRRGDAAGTECIQVTMKSPGLKKARAQGQSVSRSQARA